MLLVGWRVTGGCGLLFLFCFALSCCCVLSLSRLLTPGSPEIDWNDGYSNSCTVQYSSGSGTHGRWSWVVASAAMALMAWQRRGIRWAGATCSVAFVDVYPGGARGGRRLLLTIFRALGLLNRATTVGVWITGELYYHHRRALWYQHKSVIKSCQKTVYYYYDYYCTVLLIGYYCLCVCEHAFYFLVIPRMLERSQIRGRRLTTTVW